MLFSYIAILLLSIITSNIIFYFFFSTREKTLNREYSEVQVGQLSSTFDYLLDNISHDLIYHSSRYAISEMSQWYRTTDYREKKKFLEDFNPFSTINEYYTEALLVNRNDNAVLDIKNKIFTDIESSRFASDLTILLEKDREIQGEQAYLATLSGKEKLSLYLIKPVFNRGDGTKSFIILQLSDFLFREVLDQLFIARNAFILITDRQNHTLQYQTFEGEKLDDISAMADRKQGATGKFTYTIGRDTYYVNYSSSQRYGLNFYYGTSQDSIRRDVLHMLILALAISLLLFALLTFLLKIVTNKLYQPIDSMLELLQLEDNVDMKDEFQAIQNNISQLMESSRALQIEDSGRSSFKRSAFLKQLIMNENLMNDEIRKELSFRDLDILNEEKSIYYICACFIKPGEESFDLDYTEIRSGRKNTSFLNRFVINEQLHYDFFLDSERVLLFILSAPMNMKMNEPFFTVKEESKHSFFLCFSDPHYQLKELHAAYEEAMITLDYRTIFQDETSIHYRNVIDNRQNTFFYPFDLELKLINSLKQQNREEVLNHFSLFTKTTLRSGISFQKFRYIFFHLLDSIMKVAKDFDIPNESLLIDNNFNDNWELLESNSTSEQIINFFTALLECILTYFNEEQKSPNLVIAQAVKDFIDSNYGDRNLSLEMIADELHYSVSHISNIFKSIFGETIKNYITALRLEKARDLLINTDRRINTIAMESGYSNIGSFVKIFKAYIGETPKSYRMRIQKK